MASLAYGAFFSVANFATSEVMVGTAAVETYINSALSKHYGDSLHLASSEIVLASTA